MEIILNFAASQNSTDMRRAFLLLLAAAAVACGGAPAKSNENENKKMKKTIELTKSDFMTRVANVEATPGEWKYLGDRPAIIDFYASWCGPCKAIAPVLEELAEEYGDSIVIYKVDTEREQELAAMFGIRSIPSLLFVPMEGKPQMAQGAMPKAAFREAIDKVLLNK